MNPESAHVSYAEARIVLDDLVRSDPLRVDWQRDSYILLERIGSAYLQLGNLEAADVELEKAANIVEQLLRVDPENLDWRRDLTVVQERMGQLRIAQGDQTRDVNARQRFLSDGIAVLERAVRGRKYLLEQAPEDVIAMHDFAIALATLGKAQSYEVKELPKALASFEAAVAMMARLKAGPAAPPSWDHEIASIYVERGKALQRAGRVAEAGSEFAAASLIIRRLREVLPSIKQFEADEMDLAKLISDSTGCARQVSRDPTRKQSCSGS
jgi:tetratricopeptide (TPR) repeat protein